MERRHFLAGSAAASAVALAGKGSAVAQSAGTPAAGEKAREYYQIRRYKLQSGPGGKLTNGYLENALIPALHRLGFGPVGAFNLTYGPETPTLYVVMPSSNLETLVTVDLKLAEDAEFMKAAEAFWNAPAVSPAFLRVDSSLHVAFEGWPKLTPPDTTKKRIVQLRTYDSPGYGAHVRKMEMFHHGEFAIFQRSGCGQVFYGETLVGGHVPSLTYMLTFPDMAALDTGWKAFTSDPEWKTLSGSPRYSSEAIVNNVDNLVLTPTSYSQI